MADVLAPPLLTSSPRKLTLRAIRQPVEVELKHFQSYFREAMQSEIWLLDRVVQYVLKQKGKQIRPILVLLSAKMCGNVNEKTYHAAALVELLHTATLVHDDVVDEAERRRGMFSVSSLWKRKVAVLFGDYLFSRGMLLALDHKDYNLLHTVSDAVRRMSEGELLQLEKSRRLNIDEPTYFRIISDKTASLLAACTACGAQSVSEDAGQRNRLREAGEKLGLAFQIRDDLFDFGVDDVGKPLGIDLQEKKLTLPLIYALKQAPRAERKRIMKIVRKDKKDRDDIRTVAQFVADQGGIVYARSQMQALAEAAKTLLQSFPETEARTSMLDLVDFIVTRRK